MTTGQLIQQARKKAGLSQKQLGEKLGLSASMIGQWENDLRNPKHETLKRIAKALNVHILSLIDWDSIPDPKPGEEDEYIAEEDRDFIRKIRPHLSDLDPLTDEEAALKTLLNSMGYNIIKTRGSYFFTYESGSSEISKDDLCELLNCAQNGLKIAAKTLELKLLRGAFGPHYPDEIILPPPSQPPAEDAPGQDTPAPPGTGEGRQKPE